MRADLHRQHTLLYRALQTWGVGDAAFLQISLPGREGDSGGFVSLPCSSCPSQNRVVIPQDSGQVPWPWVLHCRAKFSHPCPGYQPYYQGDSLSGVQWLDSPGESLASPLPVVGWAPARSPPSVVSALGITAPVPLRLPESGEWCGPGVASSPPGRLQVYQSRVRSVLQEVAARESRHERRLLR